MSNNVIASKRKTGQEVLDEDFKLEVKKRLGFLKRKIERSDSVLKSYILERILKLEFALDFYKRDLLISVYNKIGKFVSRSSISDSNDYADFSLQSISHFLDSVSSLIKAKKKESQEYTINTNISREFFQRKGLSLSQRKNIGLNDIDSKRSIKTNDTHNKKDIKTKDKIRKIIKPIERNLYPVKVVNVNDFFNSGETVARKNCKLSNLNKFRLKTLKQNKQSTCF